MFAGAAASTQRRTGKKLAGYDVSCFICFIFLTWFTDVHITLRVVCRDDSAWFLVVGSHAISGPPFQRGCQASASARGSI